MSERERVDEVERKRQRDERAERQKKVNDNA